MKRVIIFLLCCVIGITHAQQIAAPFQGTFGDIIPATTNIDPGNFTAFGGATFDTTGLNGFVNLGGGSGGTLTRYITFSNWVTHLPDWTVDCNLKITSAVSGSNFGPRVGLISQNAGFTYDVIAVINTAAGAPSQQAIYNSSGTALAAFSNLFNLSVNDVVKIVGHFHDSTFSVTMTNLTTSTTGPTISYTWSSSTGTAPFMPNASKFAIYEGGGTQQLQFLHIYSTTPTHPNFVDAGASIAQGYRASSWAQGYSHMLTAAYPTGVTLAGGSEAMDMTKLGLPELRRIAPQQVLFSDLGLNDLLHGQTLTQIQNNYDSIYNFCLTANIIPLFTLTPTDSTAGGINGATAIKNYLVSKYSANYIDLYASMATSNVLKGIYNSGDGIHPNTAGHLQIYTVISGSLNIRNTNGRNAQIQLADPLHIIWNNAVLSQIDIRPSSHRVPYWYTETQLYPSVFQMQGLQGGVSYYGSSFTPMPLAAFTVTNNSATGFGIALNGSFAGLVYGDRTYGSTSASIGTFSDNGRYLVYSILGSKYAYGTDSLGRVAPGPSAQISTNYIAFSNYPSNISGTTLAPIRFNQASAGGTPAILTSPVSYVFEGDDQNVYYTNTTPTRYVLAKTIVASGVLDFPSTGAGAVADLTISVSGAAVGDKVVIGVPNGSMTTTASFFGWVSGANTVSIRFSPKATEDPSSGTFKVSVIKD